MATRLDASAFAELVEGCRRSVHRGLFGTWYRGVRFPERAGPTAAEMGLPPRERCERGRFNRAGECVLYLARTLEAVAAEVPARAGRPKLFVQRYDVDLPEARVLRRPEAGQLRRTWGHADERATAIEDYTLTHALADAARAAGVDALLYTSDESVDDTEQNLAVFGPVARRVAETMRVDAPEPFAVT